MTTFLFLHLLQASPNLESQADPCPMPLPPAPVAVRQRCFRLLRLADRRFMEYSMQRTCSNVCKASVVVSSSEKLDRRSLVCFTRPCSQHVADDWSVSMGVSCRRKLGGVSFSFLDSSLHHCQDTPPVSGGLPVLSCI